MAAKKAGVITIQLSAGVATFVQDMDRANAKVRTFGSSVRGMGGEMSRGVSSMQATSASLRLLEGGMTNNLRAAERFISSMSGIGPVLQAAFPAVGILAFAGILIEAGKKVDEFFTKIKEAPAKLTNAFRSLNDPLRLQGDELSAANAKLQADIDKLQGKRENNLAAALAEARVQADKLADSLDNDLEKLSQVMKENSISLVSGFFTGRASTSSDADAQEKFQKVMAGINEAGNESVRAATEADAKANDQAQTRTKAAQLAWDKQIAAALDEEIKKQKESLALQESLQRIHENKATPADLAAYARTNPGISADAGGQETPLSSAVGDRSDLILEQQKRLQNLTSASNVFSQTVLNESLQRQQKKLQGEADNAKLDRPFDDRMKAMSAELDGIKAKLSAIGQGEAAETLAKGFAAGFKAIEEVNKALEKQQTALGFNQVVKLQIAARDTALAEAELTWKEKLESTTATIKDRIASQELLTAAIGKGYEATKRASVETSVMGAVGGKNYQDPDWMAAHAPDVAGLRSQYGSEFDAQHGEQAGKTLESLTQQIDLEKALARAQSQGAEAVRQVTLAYRLRQIALENNAEAAKKLISAEIAKYNAERANVSAESIARIDEERAATERMTAAVWAGAEATRQAALENKYALMAHNQVASEVIQARRTQDAAQHQEQLASEAAKAATSYTDALARISQMTTKLNEAKITQGDTLGIEIELRNLENERLKIMAEMALQMGRAQDGVRAFFDDMAQSAVNAAKIIYDALHSALDKVSSELTKAMTGQKTDWGKMFQSLGRETLQASIKSGLQRALGLAGKRDGSSAAQALYVQNVGPGIGAPGSGKIGDTAPNGDTIAGVGSAQQGGWLGKLLGLGRQTTKPITYGNGGLLGTGNVPTIGSGDSPMGSILRPAGTELDPVWVRIVPDGLNAPDSSKLSGFQPLGKQSSGGGLGSFFGALMGAALGLPKGSGSGGGSTPDVTSDISYDIPGFADGTDSTPAGAYWVGENGPELMQGAGKRIASNSESRRMVEGQNSGGVHYYTIDARGTDPVQTEQRVKAAIVASHKSAIASSVQAMSDRSRRVPASRQ